MAFVTTGKTTEGQVVSEALFNQIRDNIYAAYDGVGTDALNPGSLFNAEHSAHRLYTEGSVLTMYHRFKWLAYGSTGRIIDPSGLGADVSLSDPDTGVGFYDLETISWLTYGMVFRVDGVTWAAEVDAK